MAFELSLGPAEAAAMPQRGGQGSGQRARRTTEAGATPRATVFEALGEPLQACRSRSASLGVVSSRSSDTLGSNDTVLAFEPRLVTTADAIVDTSQKNQPPRRILGRRPARLFPNFYPLNTTRSSSSSDAELVSELSDLSSGSASVDDSAYESDSDASECTQLLPDWLGPLGATRRRPPETSSDDRQRHLWGLGAVAQTLWGIGLLFVLLPAALTVAWCSIPLPLQDSDATEPTSTFFAFLFLYYGTFNLAALLLVGRLFKHYALRWWPAESAVNRRTDSCDTSGLRAPSRSVLSEIFWGGLAWSASLLLGYVARVLPVQIAGKPLYQHTLTWYALTLGTQLVPIGLAVRQTLARRRVFRRQSLTEVQRTFLREDVLLERFRQGKRGQFRARAPQSLRRFTGFCMALLLTVVGLASVNGIAAVFVATMPHATATIVLVNSVTMALVFALDYAADTIVHARIDSEPLQAVFRLYFYMLYFMFYRTLFTRLQSPMQFIAVQFVQAAWVNCAVPLTMSVSWYNALQALQSALGRGAGPQRHGARSYEAHVRLVGRSYFLRNLAESSSLVALLGWLPVLHFGPNARFYPLYGFDDRSDPTRFVLTFGYALLALVLEQCGAWLTRRQLWRWHNVDVVRNAQRDFSRHPSLIATFAIVLLVVEMDTLVSIFRLGAL